ncbi:hypothetical protein Poli38472_006435 [Pythium oligandrum]|uniref:Uncharacterized protein n=1 Tax=Pythium oligandrum TaxID=41045 RepID=A0A8K1C4S7_PYTOL|nr:hypothetical protein Poli38472_006435 [Pythium oligandrum]|eukprot:TMW56425.1 hypothetical protein Poli38472_006435 [Pythium oligandrum]
MSHASSDRETTERAEEHYMEEEKEDMADDEVHESKAEAVDATAVVLEWLHRNGMAVKPTGVKVLLSLDDDGLAMVSEIQRALPDLRMPPKAWGPLIKFVQDGVKQHEKEDPVSLDSNALELRNEEFTQPYVNQEIPYRLEACINKCWEQYCAKRPTLSKDAVFPYTTIVQSSGFGKSRLVRELAVLTNKRMPNAPSQLLEYRLLPELRKMLHQEALDTGEVGEIVARMVLLLAMDATGVVATGNEDERCYDGKFYSVATFLRTLSGDSEDVRIERGEMRDVETLLEPWESWKVGFSHFVKVSQEPTKEALWAMLARRSACILPRNFKGINLLIPIFTPSDNSNEPAVSMIVIQVKNRKGRDAAFPDSATISTRPELTFKGELSKFAIHEVLRIYMSLHGVKRMEQFFTVDPGIRKGPRSIEKEIKAGKIVKTEGPPKPDAVVLCIRGLGGWFAKSLTKGATCMEGDTEVETMELENLKTVISSGVATQLTSFLGPYWKLEEMVLADLDQRDNLGESYGMDRDEVIQIANRPMVKTVLARTWKYHATDAEALFYNDEYDDDDDDDDDDDMDHSYKTKTKQQLGSSSAEPVNKRFKES